MFEFLRNKPAEPQPQPEQKALPEPAADEAVKSAVEAALIEWGEPEPATPPATPPATMISADTKIGGSLETASPVVVAGVVDGNLTCGELTLEADGEIRGDVSACGDVVVSGTVTGNMVVEGKLTIAKTGRVIGDVSGHTIVIHDGGELRGRCSMGGPKLAAREPKPDESFIGNMFSDDDDVSFAPPELAVV